MKACVIDTYAQNKSRYALFYDAFDPCVFFSGTLEECKEYAGRTNHYIIWDFVGGEK